MISQVENPQFPFFMRKKLRVQLGGIGVPTGKPYYEAKPQQQSPVGKAPPTLLGGYNSDDEDEDECGDVEGLLQEVEAGSRALNKGKEEIGGIANLEVTERPPGLEVVPEVEELPISQPETSTDVLMVPPSKADTKEFDEAEIEAGMESFLNEVANLGDNSELLEEDKAKSSDRSMTHPASPSDVLDEITKRIDEKFKKVNAEIANEENASDDEKSKKKKRRKRKRDQDSEEEKPKKKKKKYRWKQCKDKVSGKYYFWDTQNDKTSWKEPNEPYEAYKDRQARKMREKTKESKSKGKSPDSTRSDRWDPSSESNRSGGKDSSCRESLPFSFHGAKKPFYSLLTESMEKLKGLKGLLQLREKFENRQATMIFTSFSGIKSQLNNLRKENPDDVDVIAFQARLGCRLKDWECGALASEYLVMQLGLMSRELTALAKSKKTEKKRTADKKEEEARKIKEEKTNTSLIEGGNEHQNLLSDEESDAPLVVEPPPSDGSAKQRIPGTQPYKLIRRLYISHYYEDAKTAATEWESDADTASGWVDHACLVLYVRSAHPKRLKQAASIQELLKGMAKVKQERENLLSVRDLGGDYILVEFTSEEAAYEALTKIFKCSLESPVQAYEAAKEWFRGVNNIFVQFCNKQHLTNAVSPGSEVKQLPENEMKVETTEIITESIPIESNELPEPTTTMIETDPLLNTVPVDYNQEYSAYQNNHVIVPGVNFREEQRRSPSPSNPVNVSYSAPPSVAKSKSHRKDRERPRKHRLTEQEQIKKAFSTSCENSPKSNPASHRSESKKEKTKKKRKKMKGPMGALVDKWKAASKSMETKIPKENAHHPAAVARQREKKAMRWRLEQKGDVMSNNPNLVPIAKDWKQRLLLEDARD